VSPGASVVLRALLLANGLLLAVVGFLAARYVTHPPGIVVGFAFWIGAIGLWAMLPLTDPYRHERARR
jgi:type IV secretory pathway TrbD component